MMSVSFFTPAEITDLWATWAESLIDTCAVSAIADVATPKQGTARAWPSVTQTVPCVQLSQAAAIAAGVFPDETSGATQNVILVSRAITIKAGDRITVNANGITWSVEGDPKLPGTYDPGIYLQCVKVPL